MFSINISCLILLIVDRILVHQIIEFNNNHLHCFNNSLIRRSKILVDVCANFAKYVIFSFLIFSSIFSLYFSLFLFFSSFLLISSFSSFDDKSTRLKANFHVVDRRWRIDRLDAFFEFFDNTRFFNLSILFVYRTRY